MGWWSTDILGGDTPLDYKDQFYDICEIDAFSEEGEVKTSAHVLEEHLDEILAFLDKDEWGEAGIGYQVLAVLMMEAGANISKDLRFEMVNACNEDEWAKGDEDRQRSILGLLNALEVYDNQTPIKINSKGLFEVMFSEKMLINL
jgi:hypothetical protein